MSVDVSIVVPTYNRPAALERCLEALLLQRHPDFCYDILIVDNAVSLQTRQQVERWKRCGEQAGVCIHYLSTARRGPAAARNVGWRQSTARIIAFTDDDCLPDPGWLQAGRAAFTEDVEAVTGRIVVPMPENPSDYECSTAQLENSEFATANCFYLRSSLESVGGFDERFTAAWREDSDLFFALLEKKRRWTYEPEAIVIHPVRPGKWGVSIQQQRKSMFNALLYKKHPQLYRNRIQAQPPWHYYRILGTYVFFMHGLLRRSKRQAVVGIGLWLWFTSQFCLRRLRNTNHRPEHVAEMIVTSVLIPPLSIFWRLRGALKFRIPFL
ncbi:glycosyl transferase [Dictyobacter sp. S3.2.2.5]|uniref:Glycosyl transferase n=1 Tax=Dictyobacter halimunensis TaxID=3026934 RepID=A0ABQ6FUL3_9CHLR|nr:glycosyl transferase [Dictyobacter sp. S3.2.2.5]